MVAVLYIMGVSSIREFAAPLMVGVICGAYSSVCITGALWLVMKRYYKKPVAQAVAAKNTAASAKQNNNSQDTKSGKKNSDQPEKEKPQESKQNVWRHRKQRQKKMLPKMKIRMHNPKHKK